MVSAVVLARSLQKCYLRPQHCNKEISQLGALHKNQSEDKEETSALRKFLCPPGPPPCGRCGAWQGSNQLGQCLLGSMVREKRGHTIQGCDPEGVESHSRQK